MVLLYSLSILADDDFNGTSVQIELGPQPSAYAYIVNNIIFLDDIIESEEGFILSLEVGETAPGTIVLVNNSATLVSIREGKL